MVVALIIIATISIGAETEIDSDKVDDSGLLDDSLLGWQLLYILPVAIFSNVFFLAVSSSKIDIQDRTYTETRVSGFGHSPHALIETSASAHPSQRL